MHKSHIFIPRSMEHAKVLPNESVTMTISFHVNFNRCLFTIYITYQLSLEESHAKNNILLDIKQEKILSIS